MSDRTETASSAPDAAAPVADAHGLRPGLAGLVDLMDRLLAPDGCPWDQAQTLDSLRPYLLEEAYEVLEAMDDPTAHRGELGDLLFQIVFQSALRQREGTFDLNDVVDSIRTKMIRRHPHVFATPGQDTVTPSTPDAVMQQWEAIKRAGRAEAGADADAKLDPFVGIPRALPALVSASRVQDKAAALGFDWPDLQGALDKFEEERVELAEATEAGDTEAMREELGDLLFVLCRVAGKMSIDPEDALQQATRKFRRRFAHVLQRCDEGGVDPNAAGLEQLEAWWSEAKTLARTR